MMKGIFRKTHIVFSFLFLNTFIYPGSTQSALLVAGFLW